MGIPGTGGQLLILLLFVLPGSVYQVTRARLRGPNPADQDATSRILRALAVSTLLNALYLIALGQNLLDPLRADTVPELEKQVDARVGGLVALALLFVIPVLLGALDYWRTQWSWIARALDRFPNLRVTYDPTPRAWDYGFASQQQPCFVRVLTSDDKWIGGWWGGDSFAASYPEPLELFLETAWRLETDGSFAEEIESSSGIFVSCANAQIVEFLRPVATDTPSDDTAQSSTSAAQKVARSRPSIRLGLVLALAVGIAIGIALTR